MYKIKIKYRTQSSLWILDSIYSSKIEAESTAKKIFEQDREKLISSYVLDIKVEPLSVE